jgi:SulP family sulfate permease
LIGNGAIVRSVVNTRSGGRTRWSGVIHGLVILVITLSLGALFERVPTATLAGILMMTAIGMVDWQSIKELNRLHPTDAAVMIVTAVLTFALPLTTAIGMGFLLSAILFAVRETRARGPATAIKFTLGVQKAQVDVVAVEAGITVITVNGPLFFGDATRIQSYLDGVKGALVADLSGVALVDATGAMMLRKEIWKIKSEGWTVHVCGLRAGPRRTLAQLGVLSELVEHQDVAAAVLACRTLRDNKGATA